MKTCPACHRTYADDTLAFCLDDGSPLSTSYDSEATRVIPVNFVAPGATIASTPPQPREPRGQTYSSQAIPSAGRQTNPLLYVIIALLALIAVGGLVTLLIFVRSSSTNSPVANVAANNQSDSQKQDLRNQQEQLDRERQRLEDERKKLEEQKTKPAETTAPAVDSPARITFHRGGVQETISGVVARSKSYVLKAKAGQYLSASLTSNGCVAFNTASNSLNFVTANGDNWITVVNSCGTQTPFTLTVDIR